MIPLQMLLAALLAWLDREQRDVIAFLRAACRVRVAAQCREPSALVVVQPESPAAQLRFERAVLF